MTTHLSNLFRQKRQSIGIKLGALARKLGRHNITKVCNKIQKFEAGGDIDQRLEAELAAILKISEDEICAALEADLTDRLNRNHEQAEELRRLRRSYPKRLGPYRVLWPDDEAHGTA